MKTAGEWGAYEERINLKLVTGPEGAAVAKKGTLVLVILRGETLEVAYVFYPPGRRFTVAESVEEARRQLRDFFAEDANRYAEPLALCDEDVERHFKRVFEPWTREEAVCLLALKARGLKARELVRHFERAPGAALLPPEDRLAQPEVPDVAVVHLVGARVRCGYCSHAASLRYKTLAHAAKVAGTPLLDMSREALDQTLRLFKCLQCKMKGGAAVVIQSGATG